MALTHDYTIICEMVRPELGGKFTIIGLFPNGLGTPVVPFPLPTLTFFNALRADSPGNYKFKGKLSQLLSGSVMAEAHGAIQAPQAGPVILPISLQNPQFTAFGSYTWSLEVEGQDEPYVTQFEIGRVPPQVRFSPGPLGF